MQFIAMRFERMAYNRAIVLALPRHRDVIATMLATWFVGRATCR